MNLLERKKNDRGFTLIEIIAVLVIIGIVVAVAVGSVMSTADTNRISQASVVKNHIRYAQSIAMKRATIDVPVWGIRCDGAAYWLFNNITPDTPANQMIIPGEDNVQISLANKKITLSAFSVFFDGNGRPYTAYTDATTNVPLAAPLVVTIGSIPAGSFGTFSLAPETGFIP
jgi:prepilin-type N-terminal cleavage/methylation domain-containing protein